MQSRQIDSADHVSWVVHPQKGLAVLRLEDHQRTRQARRNLPDISQAAEPTTIWQRQSL